MFFTKLNNINIEIKNKVLPPFVKLFYEANLRYILRGRSGAARLAPQSSSSKFLLLISHRILEKSLLCSRESYRLTA